MAVPLSADRLDRLEAVCRHWGGPLSAAVYAALVPGDSGVLEATRGSLQALFDRCWSNCRPPHRAGCFPCGCAADACNR